MKTPISILHLLLLSILLGACNSSPNHFKNIPDNAAAVISIDLVDLVQKANFADLKELELVQKIQRDAKREDRKMYDFLQDIMDDPTSTGINLLQDLSICYLNESASEKYYCFLADVADQEKFAAFAEKFLDYQKIGRSRYKTGDIYEYYIIDKKVAVAWNDKSCVYLEAAPNYRLDEDDLEYEIEHLFTLKEQRTLTNNAGFNDFYKTKGDIALWTTADILPEHSKAIIKSQNNSINLSDIYTTINLTFEDNAIALNCKVVLDKTLAVVYEKMRGTKKLDEQVLQYLPKESMFFSSMTVDPSGYYDYLEQEFGKEFDLLDKNTKVDIRKVLNSLGGSFALSIHDIEASSYNNKHPLPLGTLVMNLNNDDAMEELIAYFPSYMVTKKRDYYEISNSRQSEFFYLAYDDNYAVLSSDKSVVRNFKDGGLGKGSAAQDALTSLASANTTFSYIELDVDNYPPNITKSMEGDVKNASLMERKMLDDWSNYAKNVTFKESDKLSFEMTFNLKESKQNSLNTTIQFLDKVYQLDEENKQKRTNTLFY